MMTKGIYKFLLALLMLSNEAYSLETMGEHSGPIVYTDTNLTIRSTILNHEEKTFHIGDVQVVKIAVEYDPSRVRLINLDNTLIQNSWQDINWIVPRGGPRLSHTQTGPDRNRAEAWYEIQVLACPDSAEQCPGGKIYALQDIALGIDLIDEDGRVISTTDIEFRPAPGFISLASALTLINGRVESFNFYFPHRAFGAPFILSVNPMPPLMLFIVGILLLGGFVVAPSARIWIRHHIPGRLGLLGERWERVLDRLEDDSLPDEEFWEGIRVAVAWYCFDESGINPVHWGTNEPENTGNENIARLREIYIRAINASTTIPEKRKDTLDELKGLLKQE